MRNQTVKGRDALWDLLCYYLANDATYIPSEEYEPVRFSIPNSDHCPQGYKGITVFVKETELDQYKEEEK